MRCQEPRNLHTSSCSHVVELLEHAFYYSTEFTTAWLLEHGFYYIAYTSSCSHVVELPLRMMRGPELRGRPNNNNNKHVTLVNK